MTEFETGAEVDVRVSQSSLRSAREQIEGELGDVTVGVNQPRTLRSDGGVGGVASAGATAEQVSTLNSIDETVAEIRDLVERDALSGDGGGGGSTIVDAAGTGLGLRVLGGIGGAGITGALGTAGVVGGSVGAGITATGLFADSMARRQERTEAIPETTNEGGPAQATDSAVSGFLDATGIRSAAEDLDRTLGDLMSADPVIGQTPEWLDRFESPPWYEQQPEWAQDLLSEAPNRQREAPPGYTPNEYRGGYNLRGGDNSRPGGGPGPMARGPPELQSVQSMPAPPWVNRLESVGQDIPDEISLSLGDVGVSVDQQDVRRALEQAVRASNFRNELTREIVRAVEDELRGVI